MESQEKIKNLMDHKSITSISKNSKEDDRIPYRKMDHEILKKLFDHDSFGFVNDTLIKTLESNFPPLKGLPIFCTFPSSCIDSTKECNICEYFNPSNVSPLDKVTYMRGDKNINTTQIYVTKK